MSSGFGGRGPVFAIGLVLAVALGFAAVWGIQAYRMRGSFAQALRSGGVDALPPQLAEKTWTEQELDGIQVIKLVAQRSTHRGGLFRLLYSRGRTVISETAYAYQGTVTDAATGVAYLFGFSRTSPGRWAWVTVHPDTHTQYIENVVTPRMQDAQDASGRGAASQDMGR